MTCMMGFSSITSPLKQGDGSLHIPVQGEHLQPIMPVLTCTIERVEGVTTKESRPRILKQSDIPLEPSQPLSIISGRKVPGIATIGQVSVLLYQKDEEES